MYNTIRVGGMHFGLMFDCESSQVRIRRQITRRTDRLNQTKQDVGMPGSGMDEGRLRTV